MSILAGIVLIAVLASVFGTPLYASVTNPASDLSDIRAAYEGLLGKAGPNAKVVSIARSGVWLGGRSGPTYRAYEVVVERHNGERVTRTVGVPVGLFTDGSVAELF